MICTKHGDAATAEAATEFLRRSIGQGDPVGVEIVYTGEGMMIGMATESECIATTGVPASFKRFLRSGAVAKATFGPELELDFLVKIQRLWDLQSEVADNAATCGSNWRLPSLEEAELIHLGPDPQASHAGCVVCTACRIRDLEVAMHDR